MLNSNGVTCLLALIFALLPAVVIAAPTNQPIPAHLSAINAKSIQLIDSPSQKLLSKQTNRNGYRFSLNTKLHRFDIGIDALVHQTEQSASFATSFTLQGQDWSLIYTQGKQSGFGELVGDGQHWLIEQRAEQVFVVDLGASGLLPGIYQNDTLGQLPANSPQARQAKGIASGNDIHIVDLMLLYTPNIVATFPGEMTQTLLEHLVFKANQTFFDSQINMRLRLVHTEFVNYPKPSSLVALQDLADALDSSRGRATEPSLVNVKPLRDTYGADIVSMIRTHDLNEREVCGVAIFPDANLDYLVNVSNVGISGGSNCLDTFTHEIGHNFGAGHQRFNNNSQGAEPAAGAWVIEGKFNTMMSSIGTGNINRDYGLPIFSNPNLTCASVPCGDPQVANNSATMNNFAAQNAALQVATSEATVPSFLPSQMDHDGDGVLDENDAYPFHPSESKDSDLDGIGDNQDAFPNDSSEQFDTDQDGIGNNADPDDDNDGTPDINDALPLAPNETIDADGDGFGKNNDQLEQDFQDNLDFDQDGIGNKADLDDDNDGVPDYFAPTQLSEAQAWVVSAGSDSILRFDAQTGAFVDNLLTVGQGGFSFRSDAILSPAQQLYFIAFSDVVSFDLQTHTTTKVIDRSQLNTNFPAHLLFTDDDTLLVNNGLGTSHLDTFDLTQSGNHFAGSSNDESVYRDVLLAADNKLIVAQRSQNRLLSFNLNNLAQAPQVFSSQGLNKPEHLAQDANGNIYVTNAGSQDVTQFNSNGNYLGRFINPGSGGLGKPSCLTIGPEGNLYVCSMDTHQVLKFDGATGAFIEVFIQAGAGGLSQPVSLVFAGLPLDELRLDANHDSDADGVDNLADAFPLDDTESVDTDSDGVGNNADTDDDNDNLPDAYETANNLNPLDASDAQQDADNDGSSNIQEFQAGTDPNDANSTPVTPVEPEPESGGSSGLLMLMLLFGLMLGRRVQSRLDRKLYHP